MIEVISKLTVKEYIVFAIIAGLILAIPYARKLDKKTGKPLTFWRVILGLILGITLTIIVGLIIQFLFQ